MKKTNVIVAIIAFIIMIALCIMYFIYENYPTMVDEGDNEISNIQANSVNVNDYYSADDLHVEQNGEEVNINLWREGNIPTTTEYTRNTGNYFDDPDFMPYMTEYPVPDNIEVKGAVLINPGGAFQFRAERPEGSDVAEALSNLGYKSFVVHYRVRPYTMQEGALDLARAVRYVRSNSEQYGIDKDNIAIIGFSAGGILCGEEILNFDGLTNGTALDSSYVPDELDTVSADVKAVGFIYSFYGRLANASTDVELFRTSNLPPAFFAYGTEDPFYGQMNACVDALEEAGTGSKTLVVYYSAQNHTEAVAQQIAQNLGADIFELVPVDEYKSDDLNWNDENSRVTREYEDESLRDIELESTTVENWDDYDTVLIGYPIWWGIAAWPVDTFVKANDFNGKTVIPFCTSSSSGLGQSGELLAEEANGGNWLEGHRFRSNPSDSDIQDWTDSIQ